MKISLDYKDYGIKMDKLTDEQKANLVTPHEIVMSYIKGAVSQKYPKGVPNDKLRMLNTISKKFDDAQAKSSAEIELNTYENLFIRECYTDAVFDVNNMAGAVSTYNAVFPEITGDEIVSPLSKSDIETLGGDKK